MMPTEMTMRDWIAVQLLAARIGRNESPQVPPVGPKPNLPKWAYDMAEQFLKYRTELMATEATAAHAAAATPEAKTDAQRSANALEDAFNR